MLLMARNAAGCHATSVHVLHGSQNKRRVCRYTGLTDLSLMVAASALCYSAADFQCVFSIYFSLQWLIQACTSSGALNFVRWCLTFLAPQYGT
jgi:hypothetical protein